MMPREVEIIAYDAEGEVKWFDGDKGFGFISRLGYPDCFVHYTEIQTNSDYKSLTEGDRVVFDVTENHKGHLAINVRKI